MKLVFYLIILFFILIEGSITAFPWALVWIMVAGISAPETSFFLIFILGMVLDVFCFRNLGTSSIFFLISIWALQRFQRKINIVNIPYLSVFIGFIFLLYGFIFQRAFDPLTIFLSVLLVLIALWLIAGFFPFLTKDTRRIKI